MARASLRSQGKASRRTDPVSRRLANAAGRLNGLPVPAQAPRCPDGDDEEEYEKKVMTIAHQALCIGCTACAKICPKKCYTHATAAAHAIAETIALACLGDNHLWQDLLFDSRAELSALMRHWYPTLVARNHGDMKWKKFLYKQLCEREELFICKAPSCAVCCDRPVCFGPEVG